MKIDKKRIFITYIITVALLSLLFLNKVSAQNKDYHLGAKDVITLTIFAGGEKQQEIDLTMSSQGMINVPFIGPVKAGGLTITELEALIAEPLAEDYFVDPEVNIFIKEYHSLQYYISGAVKSPGLFEMTSEASLLELIAKAGGLLPERGNVAYVLRESTGKIQENGDIEKLISSKEPLKVDLKSLLDKGDMTHNLILKSGDVVYIPLEKALNPAESKIYVEGEVRSPGVFDYQPGLTALNACIMAGGFSEFAAPNRTRIIRRVDETQEIIKIKLNDIKEGNIPDIELRPGDRIHVPETWL
ncbi:SLBB domain-containing protein [Thermodesulfobacteriota bacterium]